MSSHPRAINGAMVSNGQALARPRGITTCTSAGGAAVVASLAIMSEMSHRIDHRADMSPSAIDSLAELPQAGETRFSMLLQPRMNR